MRPSTSLLRELVRKRDFYAGGLMILLGLFITLKGSNYRLGTLMHMGPGFLPTALGIILVLIGIAIGGSALAPSGPGAEHDQSILPEQPQWWGWFCILAGPVLFIICGYYFGMAPGTFACVFIAALGDRGVTFKSSSLLALIVTGFGVTLFVRFLQVPLPVFTTFPVELASVFLAAALLIFFVFRPLVGSLSSALIIAVVLAALYEGGLLYIPLSATFILAAILTYFAFQQASRQILTSFIIEIIPPVFAIATCGYLFFRLVLSVGPAPSFLLSAVIAAIFGLGLYFPPAVQASAEPAGMTDQKLWPLAPACLIAALAALCIEYKPLLVDAKKFFLVILAAIVVAATAMLWTGTYHPAAGTSASGNPDASKRLFRRAQSPVPFALACFIAIMSVFSLLFLLVLPVDATTSLSAALLVAAMFVAGVFFAPGTWIVASEPAAAPERRLFSGGESFMPYLLALTFATLAVELSAYLELFFSFLHRGVQ